MKVPAIASFFSKKQRLAIADAACHFDATVNIESIVRCFYPTFLYNFQEILKLTCNKNRAISIVAINVSKVSMHFLIDIANI